MSNEPTRQIHLDFHTSEHMPGVGSRFDKQQFQAALQAGRVNLINVFGKCHHSWCYYPTKVGRMHPTLTFDLLGAQLEACHEIGVKAPVYITVGWSANDAEDHPEWCQREFDGRYATTQLDFAAAPDAPRPICSWKFLCPNTAYGERVEAHTEEICRGYAVDGLWFDIYQLQRPCYCETCLKGMRAAGIDPRDNAAALSYRAESVLRHQARLKQLIQGYHADASIYFNGTTNLGRIENLLHEGFRHNTKLDLEDLPTTWGGYNKLPLRARVFHRLGRPLVAMSGKFHTMWGEFGGFKHRDAIRYEAAGMVANGACVNFGDQAHPDGHMDPATYANIGHAYAYIEQIEDYGIPGRPVSDMALWYSGSAAHDEGAATLLLETQHEFEVVLAGDDQDLARFRLLILPAAVALTEADAERINRFSAQGGKLLVLGCGAMDAARERLMLDMGVDWTGPAATREDYTQVTAALDADLPASPFLNYTAAARFTPQPGTELLAAVYEPYFDRTYGRYCSHQNTPNRTESAAHAAAWRFAAGIGLAHELDALYAAHGARVHRQLFRNALRLLLPDPMLEVELPSAGRATLLHQPHAGRYVVHLTHACPMKRGRCEIIEDIVPLHDVPVTVRLPHPVDEAIVIPGGAPLALDRQADGAVRVIVPRLDGHVAIAFRSGI